VARANDLWQLGEGVLSLVAGDLDGAGVFGDLVAGLNVGKIRKKIECQTFLNWILREKPLLQNIKVDELLMKI
jgi:hypothetical protein